MQELGLGFKLKSGFGFGFGLGLRFGYLNLGGAMSHKGLLGDRP